MQAPHSPSPSPRPGRLGVLLALCTVAVFVPGLRGRFLWDDHAIIEHNPALRSLGTLAHALARHFWDIPSASGLPSRPNQYYRPVVTLAYGLQWALFGAHPLGYHLVSLALHVACVLLAYGWLQRRCGTSPHAAVAAAVGAAVFAFHPTRPESVTWIAGSTDLWMALCVLCGLAAWDRRDDNLAALAIVLGMLAKESAVLVPAAIALDAVLLSPTREVRREALGRVGALSLVVAIAVGARVALVSGRAATVAHDGSFEALRRVIATLGCYTRAALFHWPPTVYLGVKLVDSSHRTIYPAWTVPLGVVSAVAICSIALLAAYRASARPWLADLGWFVFPLAPALNLVNLRLAVLAEPHNLYLPVLGLAALCTRAVHASLDHGRRQVLVLAFGLLSVCAAVTVFHETRLQSDLTLWTWEHHVDPDNLLAVQALSAGAREGGRWVDALRLDAFGCATSQRLGLRATTARFARAALEDAIVAMPSTNQQAAVQLSTFCATCLTGDAAATLSLAGANVVVPGSSPWRDALQRDPGFRSACREATERVRP